MPRAFTSEADLSWQRCVSLLRSSVDETSFKTWIDPVQVQSLEIRLGKPVLTLAFPSQFHRDWVVDKFGEKLNSVAHSVLGKGSSISYKCSGYMKESFVRESVAKTERPNGEAARSIPPRSKPHSQKGNASQNPHASKLGLNPNYGFENLIEGDSNSTAVRASKDIAKYPGSSQFNPFYIYGGAGLGKTHMLQAIANSILENKTAKSVHYVSCEQFASSFIWSVRNGKMDSFTKFYRGVDVLIVDDIQFLSGKEKTQSEFFHVFNTLHQAGKQIVLSSDRPPAEILGVDQYLISRFKWGLTIDIQPPDFDMRIAILKQKAEARKINLDEDVIFFIAQNIRDNVRELEGALNKLSAFSRFQKDPIDRDLARKILGDMINRSLPKRGIGTILDIISEFYAIDRDAIIGKSRKQNIVRARHMAMFFAKKSPKRSYQAIGRFFGGRDHSTVVHGVRSIENQMSVDQAVREDVSSIQARLRHMNAV